MRKLLALVVFGLTLHGASSVAGPITSSDSVSVNGIEWAQVDLFSSLSWEDINATCDASAGGVCQAGGTLNTWDMTGWVWASLEDVNSLFNFILQENGIPSANHLNGPSRYVENFASGDDSAWALDIFEAGFVSSGPDGLGPFISGSTRSLADPGLSYTGSASHILELVPSYEYTDRFLTDWERSVSADSDGIGAFFYRSSSRPVPTPSTLLLTALGILGLLIRHFSRQKSKE